MLQTRQQGLKQRKTMCDQQHLRLSGLSNLVRLIAILRRMMQSHCGIAQGLLLDQIVEHGQTPGKDSHRCHPQK